MKNNHYVLCLVGAATGVYSINCVTENSSMNEDDCLNFQFFKPWLHKLLGNGGGRKF